MLTMLTKNLHSHPRLSNYSTMQRPVKRKRKKRNLAVAILHDTKEIRERRFDMSSYQQFRPMAQRLNTQLASD